MQETKSLAKLVSIFFASLLAVQAASAQSSTPAVPPSKAADSLPRDQHEGLTVLADCYKDPARAKAKFGKADPVPLGILPVEVFLANSTTEPMRLNMETVQLDVHFENGQHQDVDWLPISEVARMIAHPNGPSNPHPPRFPVGVQTGADTKTDKMIDAIRPFALDVKIIPPMATIHGFLFFDLNRDMSLADHASLYVPDVTNVPAQKSLMFFEVQLGK